MSVNPRVSATSAAETIVVIPARLGSKRLPDKPLADIAGVPMIVHVWRRAVEAGVGPVLVACAEPAIADAVRTHGGEAVLTDPELASGSDRIDQALARFDPERRFTRVVNVQGDLPTLEPEAIRATLDALERLEADIGTLAVATDDPADKANPNVVKAIVAIRPDAPRLGRALYFTRAPAPTGEGPVLHHVGIYAFRRAALERFARLPASPLERRERLEQLRALEAGMSIAAALVDTLPLGVDTADDLERARAHFAAPRPT